MQDLDHRSDGGRVAPEGKSSLSKVREALVTQNVGKCPFSGVSREKALQERPVETLSLAEAIWTPPPIPNPTALVAHVAFRAGPENPDPVRRDDARRR